MMDGVRKRTPSLKKAPPVSYTIPKRTEEVYEEPIVPKNPKRPVVKERLAFHELSTDTNTIGKFVGIAIIVLIVAAVLFFVGWKTRSAEITVTSFEKVFPLAKQVSVSPKVQAGSLRVETMDVSFAYNPTGQVVEIAETAPMLSSESWYAKGTVRIFNTTSKPVKLRTETRLQNPDGEIFFSQKAVTIPAGTTAKPGTTDVAIRSGEKVSSVSSSLDDFIIPGLPAAEQKQIFARSITELSRDENQESSTAVITEASEDQSLVAATQTAEFRTWLEGDFLSRLEQKIPADFEIILGNETYSQLQSDGNGGISGVATFTLVNTDEFSDLLKNEISVLESVGKDYVLIDSMKFARIRTTGTGTASLSGNISYHVAAPLEVLQESLVDSRVGSFESHMRGLSWVKEATLSVRPWWTPKLPSDSEKLLIHYEVSE